MGPTIRLSPLVTTIVCNKSTMSADSQITAGDHKTAATKLFRRNGDIIGVAGDFAAALLFVEWWCGVVSEEYPDPPDMKDVEALVLSHTGIYLFCGSAVPIKITHPFAAIGSGAAAALGAMHMGATPQQAIKVASRVDPYTGGRIKSMKLPE